MDTLDTYSLEILILNKYMDLDSILNLLEADCSLRKTVYEDSYLIKNILKMLLVKRKVDLSDMYGGGGSVDFSKIINDDIELNIILYSSLSKFKNVEWKFMFDERYSYKAFLVRLYNYHRLYIKSRVGSRGKEITTSTLLEKNKSIKDNNIIPCLCCNEEEEEDDDENQNVFNDTAVIDSSIFGLMKIDIASDDERKFNLLNYDNVSFDLELECTKTPFSLNNLIFSLVENENYNNYSQDKNIIGKKKIIRVSWPESLVGKGKEIRFVDFTVSKSLNLYLILDDKGNRNNTRKNIIIPLKYESVRKVPRHTVNDNISTFNSSTILITDENETDNKEYDHDYILDLKEINYFKFDTNQICGKNFHYFHSKQLESMDILYFKNYDENSKMDVLLYLEVDFATHKIYFSRKEIIFKCKKTIGYVGCLSFHNILKLYRTNNYFY